MSDVKAVHIHLQVEVPEYVDLAALTKYLRDKVIDFADNATVIRLGIRPIYKETPTQ